MFPAIWRHEPAAGSDRPLLAETEGPLESVWLAAPELTDLRSVGEPAAL